MVGGCVFGKISGVGTRICVLFFPPYSLCQPIKRLWLLTCGIPREICFSRPCELEEVERFFHLVKDKKVFPSNEDKLLLKETKDGCFSVKVLYKALDWSSAVLFLVHSIWNSCVSSKVSFFAWEASWGEVLTLDQLKRKERVIANRCFLCKGGRNGGP